MGIERFFKQLKNDTYHADQTGFEKHIYLIKKTGLTTNIFIENKKKHHTPIETDILTKTTILYMDYPSIIYNVSSKFRGAIDDLLRVLIYRPETIAAYLADQDVLSVIGDLLIANVDGSTNIDLTIQNIDQVLKHQNADGSESDQFIINKVFDETVRMISLMPNLTQIYIYFDGVPNVSKMKEQIHRRVSRHAEKEILNDISRSFLPKTPFKLPDLSAITPEISAADPLIVKKLTEKHAKYTIYNEQINKDQLFNLYKYSFDESKISPKNKLLTNIRNKLLADLITKLKEHNTSITFNPVLTIDEIDSPGEAEHKILEKIKSEPVFGLGDKTKTYRMFYSPDADTILLASYLTAIGKPTNILRFDAPITRSDHKWIYQYYTMDIEKFNQHLIKKILGSVDISSISSMSGSIDTSRTPSANKITPSADKITNILADILFIFNLLGDDFLPKIDSINILNDYDTLLKTYGANLKSHGQILRLEGGIWKINSFNLFGYLEQLSLKEQERFDANKQKVFSSVPFSTVISKLDDSELFEYKKNYVFISEMFKRGFGIGKKPGTKGPTYYIQPTTGDYSVNKFAYTANYMINYRLVNTDNLDIVKNYLQGYQYILDLYFNGGARNKYWYYLYNSAPTLTDIVQQTKLHLSKLPDQTNAVLNMNNFFEQTFESYVGSGSGLGSGLGSDLSGFFTLTEHDCYLKYHIQRFTNIHSSKITSNPFALVYSNIHNIFECNNVSYINKCSFKHAEQIADPREFIKLYRYIEYDPKELDNLCKGILDVPKYVEPLSDILMKGLDGLEVFDPSD
jgi:XRN 5'-3' exonuclease N-terminus